MASLRNLPNIGKILEEQLESIGIRTPDELRTAWMRIQAIDASACYNRLCALEGTIRGVRWHDLPLDVKEDLLAFYRAHKR